MIVHQKGALIIGKLGKMCERGSIQNNCVLASGGFGVLIQVFTSGPIVVMCGNFLEMQRLSVESIINTFYLNVPVYKVIRVQGSNNGIILDFLGKTEFKTSFKLVVEFRVGQVRCCSHQEGILH